MFERKDESKRYNKFAELRRYNKGILLYVSLVPIAIFALSIWLVSLYFPLDNGYNSNIELWQLFLFWTVLFLLVTGIIYCIKILKDGLHDDKTLWWAYTILFGTGIVTTFLYILVLTFENGFNEDIFRRGGIYVLIEFLYYMAFYLFWISLCSIPLIILVLMIYQQRITKTKLSSKSKRITIGVYIGLFIVTMIPYTYFLVAEINRIKSYNGDFNPSNFISYGILLVLILLISFIATTFLIRENKTHVTKSSRPFNYGINIIAFAGSFLLITQLAQYSRIMEFMTIEAFVIILIGITFIICSPLLQIVAYRKNRYETKIRKAAKNDFVEEKLKAHKLQRGKSI